MMMMMRSLFATLLILLALPSVVRGETVVFAAASLKQPLDALAASAGDVVVSYGGSGTLARQVTQGAPASVVVLANAEWMDVLVAGGHVDPGSVVDIASNRLVLVGPATMPDIALRIADIEHALAGGRIATGMTKSVPAGIYAKAALTSLGLWEVLGNRLAEVDNVRAALTLVARGQTPLGIVYETDLRVAPELRIVARFPGDAHPPIRYVAASTNNAPDAARDFLALMRSDQGQAAFASAGFLPPDVAAHD